MNLIFKSFFKKILQIIPGIAALIFTATSFLYLIYFLKVYTDIDKSNHAVSYTEILKFIYDLSLPILSFILFKRYRAKKQRKAFVAFIFISLAATGFYISFLLLAKNIISHFNNQEFCHDLFIYYKNEIPILILKTIPAIISVYLLKKMLEKYDWQYRLLFFFLLFGSYMFIYDL